jgi:hypothetical protein
VGSPRRRVDTVDVGQIEDFIGHQEQIRRAAAAAVSTGVAGAADQGQVPQEAGKSFTTPYDHRAYPIPSEDAPYLDDMKRKPFHYKELVFDRGALSSQLPGRSPRI